MGPCVPISEVTEYLDVFPSWGEREINICVYPCVMYACVDLCAYTRNVGGVSRVTHVNNTTNCLVIKECNFTTENEREEEKVKRKTHTENTNK